MADLVTIPIFGISEMVTDSAIEAGLPAIVTGWATPSRGTPRARGSFPEDRIEVADSVTMAELPVTEVAARSNFPGVSEAMIGATSNCLSIAGWLYGRTERRCHSAKN